MADFGFVGPSYEAPSIYQDAQECINFFPEVDPTKAPGQRGVAALYPTPGLLFFSELQTEDEVRGMRTLSNGRQMVVVCGAYVYVYDTAFNRRMIGTLLSDSGIVGVTDNGVNVYIVDGENRYTWRINYPSTASSFTASVSGTTMTVTAVASGAISAGDAVFGVNIAPTTYVISAPIGGGVGTYTLNQANTAVSGLMGSTPPAVIFACSISGTTLTLTAGQAAADKLLPGMTLAGCAVGTILVSQIDSLTWTVNISQTYALGSLFAYDFTILPSTDGPFQGGTTVDIIDNYFVYSRANSQQWAGSELLSPITNPLSFGSKDGAPDDLVALIVDHREVYLMGQISSEVWTDVGSLPFAFQRIPGTSTQHGIAAKSSLARLGNSFAYVSRNNRGQAQIMQMAGYLPQRISTHAVENTLVNQRVDDAIAWTYQLEGHEIYVVSFPSLELTWAYDSTTQMWHKWLYWENNGTYTRHRGNCCALFQGKVLVGDYENGKIYELDLATYTDDGQPIRRIRRAPHLVEDLQRQYFDELQIQFQPGVGLATGQGSDPQVMLRWSNDGGSTWSKEYWTSIGKIGRYKNRAIWRRLGMSRDRIFEVAITDPVKAVIVSANLKASVGDN